MAMTEASMAPTFTTQPELSAETGQGKESLHGASLDAAKCADPVSNKLPLHLLACLPSPARAGPKSQHEGGAQRKSAPCGPPAHAPAPFAAPSVPPPPSFLPEGAGQMPQQDAPQAVWQTVPMTAPPSYRERLRAGGRGALQRSIDAGLMPKNMKQEWTAGQTQSAAQGFLPQQTKMQYAQVGDGQWGGCFSPVSHQQMQQQHPYMQQAPQLQMAPPLPQTSVQQPQMMMMQMMQQPQGQHVQMMPMAQGQQPAQMMQMLSAQMPSQLVSGDSTPIDHEFDRCMAVIPDGTDDDNKLMALKLRAAAELQQVYED